MENDDPMQTELITLVRKKDPTHPKPIMLQEDPVRTKFRTEKLLPSSTKLRREND
jgi:hypothetical protein